MPTLTPQQAFDLAMDHHRQGRFAEAEIIYRQLLAVEPGNADLVHLLGLAAYHGGRFPVALERMEQAIALNPREARYHLNLAPLLIDLGRFAEASVACETAIRLDPGNAVTFYNLGLAREKAREFDASIAAYRQALLLDPGYRMAWINLGTVLHAAGRIEEGIAHYRLARERFPADAALAINLSILYREAGDLEAALACSREAVFDDPQNTLAQNNLGVALKDEGDLAAAVEALRTSLALNPGDAIAHSNLILTLSYLPSCSREEIESERRRWNERHAVPLRSERQPHANDPSSQRRLRLGYVSADFRDHVVGRAFWPVFAAHDREQFELFAYSGAVPDTFTENFRARTDGWRHVADWSDAKLAAQIRADGIDILIDLSLHTAHNRLPAFARKPAPVQGNWLGYPAASGLETMDFRLTDPFLDPPMAGVPSTFEKPIRLPECWCIYDAPADSPDPGPLPALAASGAVTFGSFNNFCKTNDAVWDAWARILAGVAGSSLLLLARSEGQKDRARLHLERRGIDPQRLRFTDYRPVSSEASGVPWLLRYHEIDIALDPFPYNGMTTTCDALWMGVPVIALAGQTSLGRASLSLLSNVGLPELTASSPEGYVRLAATLAGDLARLASLRATLRQRMAASPLLDAPRLARHVETALRAQWERWCKTYGCPPMGTL